MSGTEYQAPEFLGELQREFAHAFAAPPGALRPDLEPLLLIRAGGQPLALRTGQISGVQKLKRLARLPSRARGLAGILAARGGLLPAYDLATLLELGPAGGAPLWVAFARGELPVALLFQELDGRAGIDRAGIPAAGPHQPLRQAVEIGGATRALIDVPSLLQSIREQAALLRPPKE